MIYLEATCGHELAWDSEEPPPADWDCPEHDRVGLWAQRLNPSPAGLSPMPAQNPATIPSSGEAAGSNPAIKGTVTRPPSASSPAKEPKEE